MSHLGASALVLAVSAGCARGETQTTTPVQTVTEPPPRTILVAQEARALASPSQASAPGAVVFQTGPRPGQIGVRFTPDDRHAIVVGNDLTASLVRVEGAEVISSRRPWVTGDGLSYLAIDATGTRAIFRGRGLPSQRHRFIWDLMSNAVVGTPLADEPAGIPAFLPDARFVVEPQEGTTLVVRSPETLEVIQHVTLPAAPNRMQPLAVGLRGQRVVYAGDNSTSVYLVSAQGELVRHFDPDEDEALQSLGERATPVAAEFRPGGGLLVVAYRTEDATVILLCHPETGATLKQIDLESGASRVAWVGGGAYLAVETFDHHVQMIEARNGESAALVPTEGAFETVHAQAVVGSDGSLEAILLGDRQAMSATGAPLQHPFMSGSSAGTLVQISESGRVAAVSDGTELRFVSTDGGVVLGRLPLGPTPSSVWSAYWTESGILAAAREHSIVFGNQSGLSRLPCGAERSLFVPGRRSSDGRLVTVDGSCTLEGRFAPHPDAAALTNARLLGRSIESGLVAALQQDGSVEIRELPTMRLRRAISAETVTGGECEDCVEIASFSANGRVVGIRTSEALRLFDTRRGRLMGEFKAESAEVGSFAITEDGRTVAVRFFGEEEDPKRGVRVYDLRGREVAELYPATHTEAVELTADGNRIVAHSGAEIAIYDPRARTTQRVADGVGGAGSIVRHEITDSQLLITRAADVDGTMTYRDAIIDLSEGPDHVIFELLGKATYTEDRSYAFLCEDYALRRIRVEDNTETDMGACDGALIRPRADGRFVAIPFGSETHIIREDGQRLVLSAMALSHEVVGYALDPATGRFDVWGASGAREGSRAPIAYRSPGPMLGATMSSIDGSENRVEGLLNAFLTGETTATEAAAAE